MQSFRFARVLLLSGAVSGMACGLPPTSPSSTPPILPPPAIDAPPTPASQAILVIADLSVPPPKPSGKWLLYFPAFTVQETGGLSGATIGDVEFLDASGHNLMTVRQDVFKPRVEPSGTWRFDNTYDDLDESVPLEALSVKVHFLGDDQRAGVASSATWSAAAAQP